MMIINYYGRMAMHVWTTVVALAPLFGWKLNTYPNPINVMNIIKTVKINLNKLG